MLPVKDGRDASLALSMTAQERLGKDPLDQVIVFRMPRW
jgi:hypothetical protein